MYCIVNNRKPSFIQPCADQTSLRS